MKRAGDPKVTALVAKKARTPPALKRNRIDERPPLTGPRKRTKSQAGGAPEPGYPAKTNAGAAKANVAATIQMTTFADGESQERVRSSGWLTADLPGSNENL